MKLREVSLPALLLAAVPHESGQQACDTMSDGRGGYITTYLHVTLPGTGLLRRKGYASAREYRAAENPYFYSICYLSYLNVFKCFQIPSI